MEEYPIKGTRLIVDGYGNLYDLSSRSIITSEFVSIKNKTYRTIPLIVNTYLEYGRHDLIKYVDKPVYLITSPSGAQEYSVNLSEFAEDNNLNRFTLHKALQQERNTKDGWSVEII
ncbi:hypothetical protein [Vibrio vulnificus]|uniref:hypothetical protein n=1 Tax=Vibrio vulnificus TaxID=672 RepID=UPI001594082A|nr:hypothetical protein [Vibrio vulnificus]NVC72619.1 hypothetical protein [Vibrio vulnificus]